MASQDQHAPPAPGSDAHTGDRRLEVEVEVPRGHASLATVGAGERNLRLIREAFGVHIASRDGRIRVSGPKAQTIAARGVLERLRARDPKHRAATREEVLGIIAEESERASQRRANNGVLTNGAGSWDGVLSVHAAGHRVRAKTPGQQVYIDAIRDHDCVFASGPAGTGKTFLAVAAAVQLLRDQRVQRVVLCRPAVEAGEKLGFLPGDLEAKVNPYLRPLLDALHDMVPYADLRRLMDGDVLEIVPLAFMRGRTLNASLIILDEAQNTTRAQMQMFLTRMGHGSKVIVNGDPTQIDLPDPSASGLIDAARRLRRVPGIGFVTLSGVDVVRHPLVQRIVDAYAETDPNRPRRAEPTHAAPFEGQPDTPSENGAG